MSSQTSLVGSGSENESEKENHAPLKSAVVSDQSDEDSCIETACRATKQVKRRVISSDSENSCNGQSQGKKKCFIRRKGQMDSDQVVTELVHSDSTGGADSNDSQKVEHERTNKENSATKGLARSTSPSSDGGNNETESRPDSRNSGECCADNIVSKKPTNELAENTDLFDAEQSEQSSNSNDESEHEMPENKLSAKYSGPAAKKASKAAKRAAKVDEKLQIYSEKQRMLRESAITVGYHEPPKKSLHEFLSDHAPQLLKHLKHPPADVKQLPIVSKPTRVTRYLDDDMFRQKDLPSIKCEDSKPPQGLLLDDYLKDSDEPLPDLLKQWEELAEVNRLSTACAAANVQSSISDARQPLAVSQSFSDGLLERVAVTEAGATAGATDPATASASFSEITVFRKQDTASKREAKKERLRRLLGSSVDLDIVPQLTCNQNGIVTLDGTESDKSGKLESFMKSFERQVALQKTAEESHLKPKTPCLSALRSLPDGSQTEISLDALAPEDNASVHKLSVLKEILRSKLSRQREDVYKNRLSQAKMDSLESMSNEALPDEEEELDQLIDSEDSMYENESGDDNSDDDQQGGKESEDDIQPTEYEKNEQLVRRVRAVLDSDDEEDLSSCFVSQQQLSATQNINSLISEALDQMSEEDKLSQHTWSCVRSDRPEVSQLSLAVEETQSEVDSQNRSTGAPNIKVNPIDSLFDDNAQDIATSRPMTSSAGDRKLAFSHAMFNTQQAESEVIGLCSGGFTDSAELKINTCQSLGQETTLIKKRPLQFSDDDDDDDDDNNDTGDKDSNDEGDVDLDAEEVERRRTGVASPLPHDSDVKIKDGEVTNHEVPAELPLKESRKKRLLREFVEEEAELSGSDASSDEGLDVDEADDILELEQGDLDDVGTEAELRQQIGQAHIKSMIDRDQQELMLMKEMLLPDGDLHSDTRRQRRFKWRDADLDAAGNGVYDGNSIDGDATGHEDLDEETQTLHERLNLERKEREKWLRRQKEKELEAKLIGCEKDQVAADEHSVSHISGGVPQTSNISLSSKAAKKKGFFLGNSRRFIDRFKETHKHLKSEFSGPTSHKNMVFKVLSKDEALQQQNKAYEPITRKT